MGGAGKTKNTNAIMSQLDTYFGPGAYEVEMGITELVPIGNSESGELEVGAIDLYKQATTVDGCLTKEDKLLKNTKKENLKKRRDQDTQKDMIKELKYCTPQETDSGDWKESPQCVKSKRLFSNCLCTEEPITT